MRRLYIAIAAYIAAVAVIAWQINEAKTAINTSTAQAELAVEVFVSDNRTVLGLCAVVLIVAFCATVGWCAGLPAAPWETSEQ